MSWKQYSHFLEHVDLCEVGLKDTDEEFDEVVKAANSALSPSMINSNVQALLDDPKSTKPEVDVYIF